MLNESGHLTLDFYQQIQKCYNFFGINSKNVMIFSELRITAELQVNRNRRLLVKCCEAAINAPLVGLKVKD